MVEFSKPYQKTKDVIGWDTSKSTRPKMIDDLVLFVKQKKIKIYDEEIIDQMRTFIKNPKTGKPEAERGTYDDLLISLSGAIQLYQIVPLKFEFEEDEEDENKEKWKFR